MQFTAKRVTEGRITVLIVRRVIKPERICFKIQIDDLLIRVRFITWRWEIVSNGCLAFAIETNFPRRVFYRAGHKGVIAVADDLHTASELQFTVNGIYDKGVVATHSIEGDRMQHGFGVGVDYRPINFHLNHRVVER